MLVDIFRGEQVGLPNVVINEYTEILRVTDTELATLNTSPLTLIPAPGALKIIVPIFVFQVVKAGSVAFNAPITPILSIGSLQQSMLLAFDASASIACIGANFYLDLLQIDYVAGAGVDAPMVLSAASDFTGGTGSELTLLLRYLIVDLLGLV